MARGPRAVKDSPAIASDRPVEAEGEVRLSHYLQPICLKTLSQDLYTPTPVGATGALG